MLKTGGRPLKIEYSIIIPAYNAEKTLANTLRSIPARPDSEIIVVIDGATDHSRQIASQFPCQIIEWPENRGISQARNAGMQAAQGEFLIFTDADVCFTETTWDVIDQTSQTADMFIGLYSVRHPHANFASQYKNLWIRYTYLQSPTRINWLFGAISVVKRSILEERHMTFDLCFNQNTLWGGEDIELGWRLAKQGCPIIFNRELEVIHQKSFTVWELLKNDFFRSAGFCCLGLSHIGWRELLRKKRYANISAGFGISILLCYAGLGGLLWGRSPLLTGALGAIYLALNLPFYHYLGQIRGWPFALQSVALLAAVHGISGIGLVVGMMRFGRIAFRRRFSEQGGSETGGSSTIV
jgi:GT2 family glycosyltransferase